MGTLSSNHFSVDQQAQDVVSWLDLNRPEDFQKFRAEFPEYLALKWHLSHIDTEESGVDPDYPSWVVDWIEANTSVYWAESEPWIDIHVDYPHEPGYLLDCEACEARCHCSPGASQCVYDGEHDIADDDSPRLPGDLY